jgi:spermidine/putrescine transport system substrate-binding protein
MKQGWRRLWLAVIGIAALLAPASAAEPKLAKTLYLYNWDNYIDPGLLKDFEKEFGVKVVEDKFASNEELLAKLQTGASGYDVAVPSDYAVRIMIRQGLLAPLDHAKLPNLRHLAPRFRTPGYDPGLQFSVPYLWGTTGIGYSRRHFGANPPASWDDLFNPEKLKRNRGRVSMLNDMREAIGAALIYRGHSPNSTDKKQLEAARVVLVAQKPFIAKYDSEAYRDSLAAGETVLAHGWSGELFAAQKNNPDIAFAAPREGTFLFVDNLVIPKSAKNRDTALVFIDYLLRPEVAARNSRYLRYPTPNDAARKLIDPNLPGASYALPNVKLYTLEDLGEAGRAYEQLWIGIKAQ